MIFNGKKARIESFFGQTHEDALQMMKDAVGEQNVLDIRHKEVAGENGPKHCVTIVVEVVPDRQLLMEDE